MFIVLLVRRANEHNQKYDLNVVVGCPWGSLGPFGYLGVIILDESAVRLTLVVGRKERERE